MPGDDRLPDLWSEWSLVPVPDNDVNSRTIGLQTPEGPVRIAVDAGGAHHLLIPVTDDHHTPRDTRSRGVMVVGQSLLVEGEVRRFTDLVCVDPSLRPVFIRLTGDICERIAEDPVDPTRTVLAAVEEWRDLFRAQRDRVTASQAEGLFGELLVLSRLALSDPLRAVDAWTGPGRTVHDFQSPNLHLEVKTTIDRARRVTIHGLDQLDPAPGVNLKLVVIHLRPDPEGRSVPDLVSELIALGVPRSGLHEQLRAAGYEERLSDDWSSHRWADDGVEVWDVGRDFPGIRRSEQPGSRLRGVGATVSYDLQLAACGQPLDATEVAATFDLLLR